MFLYGTIAWYLQLLMFVHFYFALQRYSHRKSKCFVILNAYVNVTLLCGLKTCSVLFTEEVVDVEQAWTCMPVCLTAYWDCICGPQDMM